MGCKFWWWWNPIPPNRSEWLILIMLGSDSQNPILHLRFTGKTEQTVTILFQTNCWVVTHLQSEFWELKNIDSYSGCWRNWISTCKRMIWDIYLRPYTTKINSKWIFNIRHDAVKLLEENTGKSFLTLVWGMISWVYNRKHRQQKLRGTTVN